MRHNSNHKGPPDNCQVCKMDEAIDKQMKAGRKLFQIAKTLQNPKAGSRLSTESAKKAT